MADLKIISGGQTGVDRGALDAALHLGVACGGWCPEGRKAEDGEIPPEYPLEVLPGSGYRKRTKQNVLDSDATVIIYFGEINPRSGTELTKKECVRARRPFLLIDGHAIRPDEAANMLKLFYQDNGVECLNVAGPRASDTPEAYQFTRETIELLLSKTAGIQSKWRQ